MLCFYLILIFVVVHFHTSLHSSICRTSLFFCNAEICFLYFFTRFSIGRVCPKFKSLYSSFYPHPICIYLIFSWCCNPCMHWQLLSLQCIGTSLSTSATDTVGTSLTASELLHLLVNLNASCLLSFVLICRSMYRYILSGLIFLSKKGSIAK